MLRKWKILSKWSDEELNKVVAVNYFQTGGLLDNIGALILTTDDEVYYVGRSHVLFSTPEYNKSAPRSVSNELKKRKVGELSGLGLKKMVVGEDYVAGLANDNMLYFWYKPTMKIPDSAYIRYELFDPAERCQKCANQYSYSNYFGELEFAGFKFKTRCFNCRKVTERDANSKNLKSINLVDYAAGAIRCGICRRWCTGYKILERKVNYCVFCNYLPNDGEVSDETPRLDVIDLGEPIKIVDIAGGSRFFVALTNQNCLLLWGMIYGTKYRGTALFNPSNAIFKAVSCGGNHIAALSVEGDVYTCGLGDQGQLGYTRTPGLGYEAIRKVSLAGKVQKVCCGYSSTVCLMADGSLRCFGTHMRRLSLAPSKLADGSYDELLLNQKDGDFITTPARIMLSLKVVDLVNSPLTNVYCAKTDAMMFMWGRDCDMSPQPELVLGEKTLMAALANLPATFNCKAPFPQQSTISDQLDSDLYGKMFLSDLNLVLGDGDFPAHRLILHAHSTYFRKIFDENPSKEILDMSHYNPKAYKCLLKHFYQVEPTDLDVIDLFDLYMLANSYKENAIAQEVFYKLKAKLNPETVLPLLRKAKEVNCTEFLEVCNSFVESPEFKHILAEKVSKDLDKTLSVLQVLSSSNN